MVGSPALAQNVTLPFIICTRISWILLTIFFWCPARLTPTLRRSLANNRQVKRHFSSADGGIFDRQCADGISAGRLTPESSEPPAPWWCSHCPRRSPHSGPSSCPPANPPPTGRRAPPGTSVPPANWTPCGERPGERAGGGRHVTQAAGRPPCCAGVQVRERMHSACMLAQCCISYC